MKSSLFAVAACGVAADTSGQETKCIGPRAHTVTYDIQGGDTLETVTDATISIEPEPAMNDYCAGGPSGDKAYCFGANTDETCQHEKGILPINDDFECKSCFGGVTTDLYYKVETRFLSLKKVEVGLQNTHVHGALQVHAHKDAAVGVTKGSISLLDQSRTAGVSFHVAGIIPVDIKISLPSQLEYSLGLEGHLDALAGANLDIDLGNHFVSWDKSDGFVVHNTNATVDLAPVLSLDTAAAGADIGLTLRSSMQVDIDKVMWYHVDMAPAVPSQVTFTENVGGTSNVCLKGDLDFPMSHEADVHFTLFGKDHSLYHFGPKDLMHLHKTEAINKCIDVPFAAVAV